MEKLKRSWRLFKASFRALAENKKLLLFPALGGIGLFFIALFFVGASTAAIIANGGIDALTPEGIKGPFAAEAAALLAAMYFVSMFATSFFNVAFYGEIMKALNGESVSIERGFKLALSKFWPILMWSLFAGLVGYLIKSLEEKFGFLGKLVMDFIGLAWSVASVFAIPAIAIEESSLNPVRYLKRSAETIKKTWGESLAGYVGFSALTGIGAALFTAMLIAFVAGAIASGAFNLPVALTGLLEMAAAPCVFAMIAFILACGVAEKIYLCVLYKYATEGVAPEHFSQDDLDSAWKAKK